MKKFIKRHRYTCILVFIFILLVILGLKVKQILVPDDGKAAYGERLKDIEKHKISDSVFKDIDEKVKKDSNVKNITHRIQGKTINFTITFDDKVEVKDAKACGDSILEFFDKDTLDYYSIQVFLVKDNEQLNNFPIIGMKHPESKTISWTKDREITVESEENEE